MSIDPIVVEEARKRLARAEDMLHSGEAAAKALLWFAEYANAGFKRFDRVEILHIRVTPVAGSTPNAANAEAFLKAVAQSFEHQIIACAVARAQEQFDQANALLAGATGREKL